MDSTTLKCWRGALAVILAGEASVLSYAAWSLQRFKPIEDGHPLFLWLASQLVPLAVVYLVTVGALFRYLGPRGRMLSGFVALAGMKILFEVFATIYSAHHQDFFQCGAVLMGLLIGELYAFMIGVREHRSESEWRTAKAFGCTAAVAVFAATYVSAGTGKIMHGGLDWVDSSTIRLMVLAHTEVGTGGLKEAFGLWIGDNPVVCALLQVGTILIQVSAFMLIIGPRLRTVGAILIVLFHLGIYVTSNILFLQPLLFAVVLAVPWSWVTQRVWKIEPIAIDLDAPATWRASPEQVDAGRTAWLKVAAGLVAALWLASPVVVHAEHWRSLAETVRQYIGSVG